MAISRGVVPSVVPWSLLAPDLTRNLKTSGRPNQAAMNKGVAPLSVVPWSILARDSTRNLRTWNLPSTAATNKGVLPLSVVPWFMLAPAPTRNRTTSRCPFSAAMIKGVDIVPRSVCALASSNKCTHSTLPRLAAAYNGVIPACLQFGVRGWPSCSSSNWKSFSRHALTMASSCSKSCDENSRITSCTTSRLIVSSSFIVRLSTTGRLGGILWDQSSVPSTVLFP